MEKSELTVVGVLWEYVEDKGFEWTPEKLYESLGNDSVAIGNFLLNSKNPWTTKEIATSLHMSVEQVNPGMDVLKGWYGAIKFTGGIKGKELTYALEPRNHS